MIETQRLVLRKLTMEDANSIADSCNDEIISKYIGTPFPYTKEDAESYIAMTLEKWDNGTNRDFGIELRNQVQGMISLMDIDYTHKRAELGYWLGKEHRSQKYMQEAAYALINYAWEQLGLERVYARTDSDNPKSGAVLKAVGFQQEGCLRSHVRARDGVHDLLYWGILRDETLS